MDFTQKTIAELEARKKEIVGLVDTATGEELRSLDTELTGITAELEQRAAAAKADAEIRKRIAEGEGRTMDSQKTTTNNKMTLDEIRNSQGYMDVLAESIKNGDYKAARAYLAENGNDEVRALLTENATNGTIPVPTFVSDIVKKAWNDSGVLKNVEKIEVPGNYKQGFEISATDATRHTEGGDAVGEETLLEGIVELKPDMVMKWVKKSTQVKSLRGEKFLRYLYAELAHKIYNKIAKDLLDKIKAAPTASTSTQVGVACITSTTVGVGLIAKAIGKLCDDAQNPVVIISKSTWSAFKEAQYANKFNVDPFEGLPVVFDESMADFDAASTGDKYAIVGDLGAGALANFPDGEGIEYTVDEITLKASGMIKVYGQVNNAIDVVGPGCFVSIAK